MKIESIKLDKGANVFPAGLRNFRCMTVAKTVAALADADLSECVFTFNVSHAPDKARAMKAYAKRCRSIAEGCGVSLAEPEDRLVKGFAFVDQYVMRVV